MTSKVVPELDGDALKAVIHRGSHLQIIASAGSGKTEVVAQRFADLMASGEDPVGITAFTFTERAARELKARISARVEQRLGSGVLDRLGAAFVGTIHGHCFRLLQRYVPRYETFDVLDERRLTAFLCREEPAFKLKELAGGLMFASIKALLVGLEVVENELIPLDRLAEPLRRKAGYFHQLLKQKRLVFCDSRRLVEELGAALRARGVTAFLSHASLSLDERRRAERAFADSRDCVIVATSTLELGVDVGDLDRVIQINAPATVASFLQRLGRSGRRVGSARNCLFLALDQGGLLDTAGLLLLWGRGRVEPVVPPPHPRHIVAQQILALCLQERRVGENLLPQCWNGLGPFGPSARPILAHLVRGGYLDSDDGMLFIGPEAEKRFGHRHFMELTTAFTVMPQFTVLNGRQEIGRTDPALLTAKTDGPRLLLLAGHSWQVTWIDWKRRRCFVEPADAGGKARWIFPGMGGASFALSRAIRAVLLGADPPARLTRRAQAALTKARESAPDLVHPGGTVISRSPVGDVRWWTWAGWRANATLITTLGDMADTAQRVEEFFVRLRTDITPEKWKANMADIEERLCLPAIDDKAVDGLKFSVALPRHLAEATLAARLADLDGARITLTEPHRFITLS